MDVEQDEMQRLKQMLRDADFSNAETLASAEDSGWQRAYALAHVARALAKEKRIDEAYRVWAIAITEARTGENSISPQDSIDSSSVLWEIAEDMALADVANLADETASAIKNGWKRQRALQGLKEIAEGGKGSFYKIHNNLPIW